MGNHRNPFFTAFFPLCLACSSGSASQNMGDAGSWLDAVVASMTDGAKPETDGAERTYYVSPMGSPSQNGESMAMAMDFATAVSLVQANERILLTPGTYAIPYVEGAKNTLYFAQSGEAGKPIVVETQAQGRAIFDFSFPDDAWVQDSFGFAIQGSHWIFRGIDITRAGYQGAYVTGRYNTFENCTFHHNRNTGLEINKGGAFTTVKNCDAYRNYDPKKLGSMADGFGPKETQGPGNRFIGCRAWENSDDGFDAYNSAEIVLFEDSWAFANGVDVWNYGGFSGNGNGFKVGGNYKRANHKLTRCVAFGHPGKGFDQNNNTGGLTVYNCTAYNNGVNFGFINPLDSGQEHDLQNNISLAAAASIVNARQKHNSWNEGFSVTESDFLSLDTSLATQPRLADGRMPISKLFHLAPQSALIDAGTEVGLSYTGKAIDLGAFELTP